jgi:hypothetical protein
LITLYRRPLQTERDGLCHTCGRQNTLEKGVDGGQKTRRKQFILWCVKSARATWPDTLCKIGNWSHELIGDKERAEEV